MKNLSFFVLLVLLGSSYAIFGPNKDKVLLTDVQVLTLHRGQQTAYRRTSAVPQLECVGGSAREHSYEIETVQCKNQGSDGIDVQWRCESDLSDHYRFGQVEVLCEGYGYPEDPYILKGSCGLQYTLELTKPGQKAKQQQFEQQHQQQHQQQQHQQQQQQQYRQQQVHNHRDSSAYPDYDGYHNEGGSSTTKLGSIILFAVIAFIFWNIYKQCTALSRTSQSGPGSGSGPFPGGFPGFGGGSGSGHTDPSCNPPRTAPTSSGWRPGFWSGLAAGGLLTRLFGGGNNAAPRTSLFGGGSRTYANQHYAPPPSYAPPPTFSAPPFTARAPSYQAPAHHSPDVGTTRTAAGFGGTKRR